VPKNNLDARLKQWEMDKSSKGGPKTEMHKPGYQKK
jgi:hypothetical protein